MDTEYWNIVFKKNLASVMLWGLLSAEFICLFNYFETVMLRFLMFLGVMFTCAFLGVRIIERFSLIHEYKTQRNREDC